MNDTASRRTTTAMSTSSRHYGLLIAMAALSFISMYVLMYAMVDSYANVFPNLTRPIWPAL